MRAAPASATRSGVAFGPRPGPFRVSAMKKATVHMVSLGCPKNRVDSEVMLGLAVQRGFQVVDDPALAEVIVVNTCGFIDAAKRESIDTILGLAKHKQRGTCKRLVVTGCLVQRYADELAAELPEVDHLLGSGDVMQIGSALDGSATRVAVGDRAGYLLQSTHPRVLSTGPVSAYVKIAEGCDRRCAFCVIPQIRGRHRSRTADDIVAEVQAMAAQGILEVNLVSQDTIGFGRDLGLSPQQALADLVSRVADVPGIRWVRLLYLYPDALDDALLDLLANHPRVVPYVDMPMQHASDEILRRMRRGHTRARLAKTIERLRHRVPSVTIRTAFIVGFPGETERHFQDLCDFVQEFELERVGVFRYSDEEGSASAAFDGKVPRRVSYDRARHLMALQRRISRKLNRRLVGTRVQVLVEGASEEHEYVLEGRHAGQAPDIDGQIWFTDSDVQAGELWEAQVARATDYDLVVRVVGDHPLATSRKRPPGTRRSLPVLNAP